MRGIGGSGFCVESMLSKPLNGEVFNRAHLIAIAEDGSGVWWETAIAIALLPASSEVATAYVRINLVLRSDARYLQV